MMNLQAEQYAQLLKMNPQLLMNPQQAQQQAQLLQAHSAPVGQQQNIMGPQMQGRRQTIGPATITPQVWYPYLRFETFSLFFIIPDVFWSCNNVPFPDDGSDTANASSVSQSDPYQFSNSYAHVALVLLGYPGSQEPVCRPNPSYPSSHRADPHPHGEADPSRLYEYPESGHHPSRLLERPRRAELYQFPESLPCH